MMMIPSLAAILVFCGSESITIFAPISLTSQRRLRHWLTYKSGCLLFSTCFSLQGKGYRRAVVAEAFLNPLTIRIQDLDTLSHCSLLSSSCLSIEGESRLGEKESCSDLRLLCMILESSKINKLELEFRYYNRSVQYNALILD